MMGESRDQRSILAILRQHLREIRSLYPLTLAASVAAGEKACIQSVHVLRSEIAQNFRNNMETSGGAVLVSHTRGQQEAIFTRELVVDRDADGGKKARMRAEDSLFQVIEKLSEIVEKQRPRRCPLSGRKRPRLPRGPTEVSGSQGRSFKKPKDVDGSEAGGRAEGCLSAGAPERTITLYQCSVCSFTSLDLPVLKDHLQQHQQPQTPLLLACSQCTFVSRHQGELEAHIRLHLGSGGHMMKDPLKEPPDDVGTELECSGEGRAGIRVSAEGGAAEASSDGTEGGPLKEKWYSREQCGSYRCLICSYVCGQQRVLKTHAWKHAGLVSCSYPIFEDGPEPEAAPLSPPEGAVSVPTGVGSGELETPREQELKGRPAAEAGPVPEFIVAEEPTVELQVTVETEVGRGCSPPGSDSLLFAAQKIMGGGSDVVGHLSVIVERLPEAGETPAAETFLMHADVGANTRPLGEEEEEEEDEEAPVAEANVPPFRRRTQSECLRLHSLAAEALVAMPMTAAGPANTSDGDTRIPQAAQHPAALGTPSAPQTPPTQDTAREGVAKSPAHAGISLSLLTVIERLRERTNEDASDEDILRELWDNGQSPPGGGADPPVGDLTEARPGSERPHRWPRPHRQSCQCPARHGNDLDNHMTHRCKTRVHCSKQRSKRRQLQNHKKDQHGYGETLATIAPVVETMAPTDDTLEKKAVKEASQGETVYRCEACDFTSSSYIGVRNHQRIHCSERPYRCCSCDFATSNMSSLRSHMRRHPEDHQAVQLLEQYRCSLCGYVCSHPPSLKSHMWKHAGDQNYNYQQVNRAIDQAISQSSRAVAGSQSAGPGFEPWEQTCAAEDSAEMAAPHSDPRGAASADRALDEAAPACTRPGGTPAPPSPGAEYCVLLFCCCICGYESPSKERLMEHMKNHEGEIISIILSRDHQPAPPAGR
ncbi:hypothetical protein SKAU_G00345120 [Synaphobranchus kaupii]|uniref:C2H2-type domain-containing protein n=1 Tax=Synaphobranchus kaupii TaxID=118154 RepID=A0A9Q1EJF7_SYNKA|nr:hypothetical protein SKAU_G00345120 [Synaphobranchus kaupii]